MTKTLKIIRRPDVETRTGMGRARIYEEIHAGRFPRQVNLGRKAVGWVETEIEEWIAARIAERDSEAA